MRSHAKPWWRSEAIDYPIAPELESVGFMSWFDSRDRPNCCVASSDDNGLTWNICPRWALYATAPTGEDMELSRRRAEWWNRMREVVS